MKSLHKYIAVALLAVCATSCKDFLETDPYDAISNELALGSYANLSKATNGLYAPLRSSSYYGAQLIISGDVMADNVGRSSVKSSSRYIQEFDLTMGPSVGYYSGLWTRPYSIINSACQVINTIDKGDFDRGSATDAQVDQLLGEALFIRALCHFDLCRSFAHHYTFTDAALALGANGQGGHLGVPVITKHDITSFPARNTVKEVYDQVIADLTRAEKLITFDKGRAFATANAVKALLARVYLYKEDWANAAKYAEEVIASGEYPLSENDDVVDFWVKDDGDETIFQLPSISTEDYFPGNESLGSLFNIGTDFPYSDLIVQPELFNLFDNNDLRKNLYYTDVNGEIRVKKFLPKQKNTSPYENNIKVLRVAEMYLISAEANMYVDPAQAQTRFNELRQTRGLASVPINSVSITLERRKELACEGHRVFDLARSKKDNVRSNSITPKVAYPSHLYIFPIPAAEIQRNKNIEQNVGF
ncbi:MAG: RagB/SusD family nutrient uptake outer membrane protein [Bacteroidales bacterium]|nr:RagB/SusD family nutrient uptake outer membrane protein [Bacteroidales bacterium]MBN2748504.1 RagB/SusD family nutrient uptake outer membrane protein [Bacteroidales bacterium]